MENQAAASDLRIWPAGINQPFPAEMSTMRKDAIYACNWEDFLTKEPIALLVGMVVEMDSSNLNG